jgi:inner membrane protein
MQKKLFLKLAVIALLSMSLLVPLAMIEAQIAARGERQADVLRDIAASAAGEQTLLGPVLAVHYRERVTVRDKDPQTGRETLRQEEVERVTVLPPLRLDIDGDACVEARHRGLYRANLYRLGLQLRGRFEVPPGLGLAPDRDIVGARAFLVLGVSDPRGIDEDPQVTVDGKPHRFATGSAKAFTSPGLNVALGEIDPAAGAAMDFAVPLALTGTSRLAIAPAGDSTKVTLRSAWPHPSFQGRFLPIERTVGSDGFEARWQVSHLARDFGRVLASDTDPSRRETLEVSFVEPVNVYLKGERAVKYGVLFVVLTFAAFFLFEVLRRLPIHPLQYLLVGLALALFFLLLVALSEHVPFALAYAVSATACVALIGTYLAGALGSRLRGASFGLGIAALYGVLYGVLRSEDNALLMGSLLLFAALGATMLATRRVDWYQLGTPSPQAGR